MSVKLGNNRVEYVQQRYRGARCSNATGICARIICATCRSGADPPFARGDGRHLYAFSDLAVIRQADAALAGGASFRAVLRSLLASRSGQLAFDFRLEAQPAKVLQLKRPEPPPLAALMDAAARRSHLGGAALSSRPRFSTTAIRPTSAGGGRYRRALEIDPYLVPALINLANIHYARDEIAEAQALYERAIALEPDVFEAHFNLGNIFHDLGRYAEAQACYRDALRLNPTYADAHFYLAVTLEKSGQSQEARPHWRAYQQLAPNGEWVDLARGSFPTPTPGVANLSSQCNRPSAGASWACGAACSTGSRGTRPRVEPGRPGVRLHLAVGAELGVAVPRPAAASGT
jgi:tetratricopeptide (TPR) repeat protein